MSPRITLVGGGSTHWTPKLLVDFLNTPSLRDATIVLHDLDVDALPPMLGAAEHAARLAGSGLQISATSDLGPALDGADFVVTTLSVGGFESMGHDLEIPERYGIRQPVGDSVGPGGVMRSLRSAPVLVAIAREMETCCPDAWLVNVSNPLTALCRAVTAATPIRAVGLCNELVGFQFQMSLLFDADMRSVDPVVAGVNHLPLVAALRIGDRDGFAMLREVLEEPTAVADQPLWMTPPAGLHWRKVSPGEQWTKADVLANNRIRFELFRDHGLLPGATDTHTSEFFAGFVTEESDWGRSWGVHHYGLDGHRADKADDDASVPELRAATELSPFPSGELVAPLLDGLVAGTPRSLPVNLPNTGQVANLPEATMVECIGIVDAEGVRPRDGVTVPGWLGEHLRRVAASQELTVAAALSGDAELVLAAMLADPQVGARPYEDVVALTGELLEATAPWLPQFDRG